jgi:YfiH family protein
MSLLIPHWAGLSPRVGACVTTRRGGVSMHPFDDGQGGGGLNPAVHVSDDSVAVAANRLLIAQVLPSQPAWLTQVHGTHVVDAATVMPDKCEADAAVTSQRGVVCAIMTADCLPVLFSDTDGTVVAAAHAGWRGLVSGVLENTVSAMQKHGAGTITAWLGPAIGPAQFEVGQEVLDAFVAHDRAASAAFVPVAGQTGKYLADIYQLARLRLAAAGVQHVSGGGMCTVTEKERFYSYRRDKTTGRMAALIWLK